MQDYAAEHGVEVPLDIGSRETCQIGGNLATNASGKTFGRHNSMHANCVGLKAVLANGDILDNMTTLRKDNTGYDLKQLFIGSEGTLGIITECALLCAPLPKAKNLIYLSCASFDAVLSVLQKARTELGDILRCFKFQDLESVKCAVAFDK